MCCGNGLGAITGRPIRKGAPFQLGVELQDWWQDLSFEELPDLMQRMESALTRSGYVSGLVKAYQLAGVVNPFIVIESYSGREYGSDQHLKDAVLSVLQGLYNKLNFSSVTFTAETYDPSSGTTAITTTPAPRSSTGSTALDQLGATIGGAVGVDSTSGLLLGALAVVGVVILMRR